MKKIITNKEVVIKHSGAIQISNEANLLQRRAWNVLLANAFDDLEKKEAYKIDLKDLRSFLKFDKRNNLYLKQLLKALVSINVEWNILGKDKSSDIWGVAALLAEAEIINGICYYSYGARFRKRLHNPTMYAKISLSLQNKFNSKHSLALYELFVDYFNLKISYGETPWILVEKFRKLLGLKKNEYKDFKILNRDIIKKALKEINAKSDLFVTSKYQRKGRKIEAIKFFIKKNPKNAIDITTFEYKSTKTLPEQTLLPIEEFQIDNQDLLQILVSEFGISNNKAIKILKSKDEFYIKEVLETVRKQIEKGKIKDISAFTVSALDEDYRSKEPDKKQLKTVNTKKKDRKNEIEKLLAKLDNEVNVQRSEQSKQELDKLTENELKKLKKQFGQLAEQGEYGDFVRDNYKKRGLNGSGVKVQFSLFVLEKLLPSRKDALRAYAKLKGHDHDELKAELKALDGYN
jgi:plasmid replication initiation protein